jgi:UDP-glucose 4-epimerase
VKALVTGGAGFIGSHLARRLIHDGHEVVVVDDFSTGRRANVPGACAVVEADVSAPIALEALPSNVDVVCHFAAQSSGPASAGIPYRDLQSNAASTLLLSRWCLEHGVPRFVYASSMAVYGNVERLPASEETTPCRPRSYYGVSKLSSEHLLQIAAQEGLNCTCLRFFTVYGPGQNLDNLQQGIVSIYLAYMLRSTEVPITGSLERFRDLVHVDDVVELCATVISRASTPSPVYNVGAGRPVTVRELLQRLVEALGVPEDFPIRELAGSASDQFGLYADISRASTELGWKPQVDLAGGLRGMAEWARDVVA